MKNTYHNTAFAIEDRRRKKEAKEQRHSWMKALVFVACVGGLGLIVFYGVSQVFLKKPPVVHSPSELKWGEVKPDSKDYEQPANAALAIFDTMTQNGLDGIAQVVGRNIPPEIAAGFAETINIFKGGTLTIQAVRKKNDDPAGRYEVFCKSPAKGHRLKLQLTGENGTLKLTGADMVP